MTNPSVEPPEWDYCGDQSHTGCGPEGCRGVVITPHRRCLAHLSDAEFEEHRATLNPGSNVDYRGTSITPEDWVTILTQLATSPPLNPKFGEALFRDATFTGNAAFLGASFTGDAEFSDVTFEGGAIFDGASFKEDVTFHHATFKRTAGFTGATFENSAVFDHATFERQAEFDRAKFKGNTWFTDATFEKEAWFTGATLEDISFFHNAIFTGLARFESTTFGDSAFDSAAFIDEASFEDATFQGDARFWGATFDLGVSFASCSFVRPSGTHLGPFACRENSVVLSGTRFEGPTVLEIEGGNLRCERTQWLSAVALRLRHSSVDLSDAVVEYPLSLSAHPTPFTLADRSLVAPGAIPGTRVTSLRGIDAAHLVLTDVDLSSCLFTGTVHLDQLKLEGDCAFPHSPRGLAHRRGWQLRHWTPRRTLFEEQQWRAHRGDPGTWATAPLSTSIAEPTALTAVYRSLRKSMEDGKNEPDAADFYYGEMEMRRADKKRPLGERLLLWAYWAVSGYGLRASRALGGLLVAMTITVLLMMQWGLAQDDPKPVLKGTQAAVGQPVRLTTDTPEPVNPTGARMTKDRFEKSLRVVINSVIFHSSGQNLTTTGTYVEMASRIGEPVLLGLGLLAIRGRVKR